MKTFLNFFQNALSTAQLFFKKQLLSCIVKMSLSPRIVERDFFFQKYLLGNISLANPCLPSLKRPETLEHLFHVKHKQVTQPYVRQLLNTLLHNNH